VLSLFKYSIDPLNSQPKAFLACRRDAKDFSVDPTSIIEVNPNPYLEGNAEVAMPAREGGLQDVELLDGRTTRATR